MFGAKGFDVDALKCGERVFVERDAGRRDSVTGGGHTRRIGGSVIAAPFKLIDDFDLDGALRAGVDAGWFEACSETTVAHITFADDAALGIELRDGVGTVPDAVLAADAGFGGVEDDTGDGIFFIGIHGAAAKAVGGEAVVAAHGEIEARSEGPDAAFDFADPAPAYVSGVAVLLVARDLTGAAADALGHVEMEAVLLAGAKFALRNERCFYFGGREGLGKD